MSKSLSCKMNASMVANRVGQNWCRVVEVRVNFFASESGAKDGEKWKSGAEYFIEKIFDVLRTEYKLREIDLEIGDFQSEEVNSEEAGRDAKGGRGHEKA